MAEQLLPCPFCGGEGEIIQLKEGRPWFCVACKNCKAQGHAVKIMAHKNKEGFVKRIEDSRKWAVKYWNKRNVL